jgi:Contractile injection system tape measure protein
MNQQRHIIGRTVLEIAIDRQEEVWNFQNEMSDLLWQQAIPAMERLFDQLVGENEVIRLDQVVLELTPVNRHWLADEFVRNLLDAMSRTLRDRLSEQFLVAEAEGTLRHNLLGGEATLVSRNVYDGKMKRDLAGSDWEALFYFLRYGRLPWWCPTQDWQSWIQRWEVVLQTDLHWQEPLRALLVNHFAARQRLVVQFSESFRHQVLIHLQPTWISWPTLLAQAQTLLESLGLRGSTAEKLRTQAWILLLSELGQGQSPDRPHPTMQWMRNWLLDLMRNWQPELLTESRQAFIADDLDAQSRPAPLTNSSPEIDTEERPDLRVIAYQRLHSFIESFSVAERALWHSALDQITPLSLRTQLSRSAPKQLADNDIERIDSSNQPLVENEIELTDSSDQQFQSGHEGQSSSASHETDNASRPPEISSEAINEDSETPVGSAVERPDAVARDLQSVVPERSESSPLSPEEEEAGIYVNQSGLVILHPFLRLYFEDVGLLNGEAFRDEIAQQTAIYLLHYLATGQTDAPEYELVLPKLLCGWPLSEPLTRGLVLPDVALAEGENLLQAVINYWQVLKSTSPDGLREGFLQREGKVTRLYEGDWRLQVEQRAIDVLLGSLPWGLSVVKLPWMENLLMVEWG